MKDVFLPIEEAILHLKKGEMVILVDDESRENEGDLVINAEFATADAINFMARFGRGLICLAMTGEMIDRLKLPLMTSQNRSPFGTAFTVSIEAREGVSTGISTKDRARTIQVAISKETKPEDLISPGHMFPLRARDRGVLERQGQTEGSVDLMKLTGLTPASVICEIMSEDGSMCRREELRAFSKLHNIPLVSIEDLRHFRIKHEMLVTKEAEAILPIERHGDFTLTVFKNALDKEEHFALVKPPRVPNQVPLVRIHSECITGDVFGSCRCDCGGQLERSLSLLSQEGGVLIYLRQEGRGIGLSNKLKAYALQDQGYDTVEANLELGLPADTREYAIAYQILKYLGIEVIKLLTNNPEKIKAMEKYGLKVSERVPVVVPASEVNLGYLRTKQTKLGHLFSVEETK